jgi:hypothetical protein
MNEPHNFYLFIFFIYTLGHSSCGGDTCHSYYNNNNQPIYLHIFKSHTHTHTLCVCRNLNLFPFFHWWNLFKFVYHFYFDREKSMTSLFIQHTNLIISKKGWANFHLCVAGLCVLYEGAIIFFISHRRPLTSFLIFFPPLFFSIG